MFIYKLLGRWRQKGSYTIEASLVIPIILLVIYIMIHLCLNIYEEVANEYEIITEITRDSENRALTNTL